MNNINTRGEEQTWPRVMGSSLPVGGPGRLPPRVRDENALLYSSLHFPCSLSRPTERSTGPPTASSSFAAASAFCRSSVFAARPLFSPETALCVSPTQICQHITDKEHNKTSTPYRHHHVYLWLCLHFQLPQRRSTSTPHRHHHVYLWLCLH